MLAILGSLGWWRTAGFTGPSHWRALHLFVAPALLVGFVVVDGASEIGLSDSTRTALQLPQPLLTGFWEEGLIRGFLLFALLIAAMRLGRGPWPAVIGSSVVFGLMHFVSLLNGADPAATASQVLLAGLLGALFAALLLRTNALWPLVLLHGLYDLPSALRDQGAEASGFQAGGLIPGLLFALYAVFLLRRVKDKDLPGTPQ